MSFNRADYERTFAFAALVYTKSLDKQIKRAAVEVMASVEHVVGQLHVSSDKFADPLGAANVETLRLALGACHCAVWRGPSYLATSMAALSYACEPVPIGIRSQLPTQQRANCWRSSLHAYERLTSKPSHPGRYWQPVEFDNRTR